MKKIVFVLMSLFAVSTVTVAQETKKKEPATQKTEHQKHTMSECCMMKGGKMYHYKDGKETPVVKETDFHGMKVMPDGTCQMKNGKSMKLKEGECCDMNGHIQKDCEQSMKK